MPGAVAKAGGTARDASRPVGREALCWIDSPRQPAGGNSASRRHGRRHMGEDKEAKVPAPGETAGQAGEIDEYFEAVVRGSAEELLDAGAHSEIDAMRHSAAHVMAEAVVGLFPDAQLGIGPSIDDGFYYDFLLPRPLTPADLASLEVGTT